MEKGGLNLTSANDGQRVGDYNPAYLPFGYTRSQLPANITSEA